MPSLDALAAATQDERRMLDPPVTLMLLEAHRPNFLYSRKFFFLGAHTHNHKRARASSVRLAI